MKKPLTLVPPAQAEALYDAALQETPRGHPKASAVLAPPRISWDVQDWGEDDSVPQNDDLLAQFERAASKAQDWPSSSKSSR